MFLLAQFAVSVVTFPGTTLMWYCGIGLLVLFCMHCFWFYLFLGMGAKFLKKGGAALPQDTTQNRHARAVRGESGEGDHETDSSWDGSSSSDSSPRSPKRSSGASGSDLTRRSPRLRK